MVKKRSSGPPLIQQETKPKNSRNFCWRHPSLGSGKGPGGPALNPPPRPWSPIVEILHKNVQIEINISGKEKQLDMSL